MQRGNWSLYHRRIVVDGVLRDVFEMQVRLPDRTVVLPFHGPIKARNYGRNKPILTVDDFTPLEYDQIFAEHKTAFEKRYADLNQNGA